MKATKFNCFSNATETCFLLIGTFSATSSHSNISEPRLYKPKSDMDATAYLMNSPKNRKRIRDALKSDSGNISYKNLEELKSAYGI